MRRGSPSFLQRMILPTLVLSMTWASLPVAGAVIDVGVGPGCEASTLAAALDLADDTTAADEIRLQDGVTYSVGGTLQLTNWSSTSKGPLTISGGYSDCLDTTREPTGFAEIENPGSGPTILIDTTGGNTSLVTLETIEVVFADGRGIAVEGNSTVSVVDSVVLLSSAGVAVSGGASFTMSNTTLQGNGPTTSGGGVFCTDPGSEVFLQGVIRSNEATNGGGIAIVNGCEAVLQPTVDFRSNEALTGGAIFADSGSVVSGIEGGVEFFVNDATLNGGTIAADGMGTQVLLAGADIDASTAGFRGGAIHASNSAFVALSAHDEPCQLPGQPTYVHCPSILERSDLGSGAEDGSVVAVMSGAEVRLLQTLVTRSSLPFPDTGTMLYAAGSGSVIRTESVQVSRGIDHIAAFHAEDGAEIYIAMTTVTENYFDFNGNVFSEGVRLEGPGTRAEIHSSIFHPVSSYVATGGATFAEVDCLITSTTNGLVGTTSNVVVADPLFVSPPSDFELQRGSPAIDFCDDGLFLPTGPGLNGLARGMDDPEDPQGNPGVSNAFATFDLGAYPLAAIFADGFESGNTTAWDASVP
ncbi:MAG: hypothetical protein MPN21_18475 [Thermoanaerobaculia bacterium]|nr:hypothetical protein [Thermoanaerobaculia bacterium]